MANFNKVILIGNVTRAIELKYTAKGTAFVDIGFAVGRKYKKQDGSTVDESTASIGF